MKSQIILSAVAALAVAGSAHAVVFATSSSAVNAGSVGSGSHIGTAFTVGALPIEVSALGGFDASGIGAVNVTLWDSTGTVIANTGVNYTGSLGYVFNNLGSPITLSAGSQYFIAVGGPSGASVGDNTGLSYNFSAGTVDFDGIYGVGQAPLVGAGSVLGAGTYSSGNFQYTVVPEPETYAMIAGLGLVGFGLWRRRQAK